MAGSKSKQKPTRITDMRSFHDLRFNRSQTEGAIVDTAFKLFATRTWQDYILKVSQVSKPRYLAHSEDAQPGAGKRCSWRDDL